MGTGLKLVQGSSGNDVLLRWTSTMRKGMYGPDGSFDPNGNGFTLSAFWEDIDADAGPESGATCGAVCENR